MECLLRGLIDASLFVWAFVHACAGVCGWINRASQYDNVFHEIKAVASADVAHRKVFVRGLAWETTTERLKDAFAAFGDVEEGAVIHDKATNKSRGYGFVTFVDMEAAQRAVTRQSLEIDVRLMCVMLWKRH